MQQFLEVLSPQERVIWAYKAHGLTRKEIAKTMGVKPKYVAVYEKRLKEKIDKLTEQGIIFDGSPAEVLFENQVEEIFEVEQLKNLPRKTVKQAQFLQDTSTHAINKKESGAQRRMRSRLGVRKKQDAYVYTRQCTQEELDSFQMEASNRPPNDIMKLKREYDYFRQTGEGSVELLASMEVILRSYGVLLFSPNINKRNAKTVICQRAMTSEAVVVVKGDEQIDAPNPKFIEATINEDGQIERVYIVDKKPPKRKKRN